MNCSFQRLVGGSCCPDKRSRDLVEGATTVPLTSCTKDITGHIRAMGINDVDFEVNLILVRASIFACPPDLKKMTICPSHRSSLGIRWRRGSQRCRVPGDLASHKQPGRSARKADRGINKSLSKTILRWTGIFIPAGSGTL